MTTDQRWGATPTEAASLLGLSRRTFYRQVMPYVASGTIRSAKIGRVRLIELESLRAWWQKRLESDVQ
jgi:excisionase family DNA binding protein